MRTKALAEAALAACGLVTIPIVEDYVHPKTGQPRRAFHFTNPNGAGGVTADIPATPTPEHLEALARHLPIADTTDIRGRRTPDLRKRADVLKKLLEAGQESALSVK